MNILSIAIKGIKQDFRDRRTLVFMIAFPIVLMLILGLTLTNAFSSDINLGDIKVIVKDTSENAQLSQAFEGFAEEMGQSGVIFDALKTGMDGREEVEENRYVSFVELEANGISFYGSSRNTIASNIVQGMVTAFTDKYNAVAAVAKSAPDQVDLVLAENIGRDYIKETSIRADRQPGSIDYYALAMTVMIGMWGAMSAGSLIRREIVRGTVTRLMASPIRKSDIFIGKVLGNIVINVMCVLVIVLFSKFVFNAYWGEHMGLVFIVLLTEVVLGVSFGFAGGYLLRGNASRGIIMIIVQLAAFFGGAYFPIGDESGGGLMGFLVNLSPIRWGNHALTELIYANDLSAVWPVVGLNMGFAVLFLGASAIIMRRREGL